MKILNLQYDEDSTITINRNGTASNSPLIELQNNHIYDGDENELVLSRIYTTSFTCEYEMSMYPFDNQQCYMVFIMKVSRNGETVISINGSKTYNSTFPG